MAIAYFGGGGNSCAGATSLNLNAPASIPAGAIIIATLGGYRSGSSDVPSFSGGGWTLFSSNAAGNGGQWAAWKIAAGNDTVTATMANSMWAGGGCLVFTGVDGTTPIVNSGSNSWAGVNHTSADGGATTPSVNNTVANACAVITFGFYNGGSGGGNSTPANCVEAYDFTASPENSSTAGADYRLNAPTGAQTYTTLPSGGQSDWYGGITLAFLAPFVSTGPISASAGNASVTSSAQAATVATGVAGLAGAVSAAASAKAPSAVTGSFAAAGHPVATASAQVPTTFLAAHSAAGRSSATGAALSAAAGIGIPAGLASASASARPITATLNARPVSGVALATATVLQNGPVSGRFGHAGNVVAAAAAKAATTALGLNVTRPAGAASVYSSVVGVGAPAGLASASASAATKGVFLGTPWYRTGVVEADSRTLVVAKRVAIWSVPADEAVT